MRKFFKSVGKAVSKAFQGVGDFVKKNPIAAVAGGLLLGGALIPGGGIFGGAKAGSLGKALGGLFKNDAVKELGKKLLAGVATNALAGKPKSAEQHTQDIMSNNQFTQALPGVMEQYGDFGNVYKGIMDNPPFEMPEHQPSDVQLYGSQGPAPEPLRPVTPGPQVPGVIPGEAAPPVAVMPPDQFDLTRRPRATARRGY